MNVQFSCISLLNARLEVFTDGWAEVLHLVLKKTQLTSNLYKWTTFSTVAQTTAACQGQFAWQSHLPPLCISHGASQKMGDRLQLSQSKKTKSICAVLVIIWNKACHPMSCRWLFFAYCNRLLCAVSAPLWGQYLIWQKWGRQRSILTQSLSQLRWWVFDQLQLQLSVTHYRPIYKRETLLISTSKCSCNPSVLSVKASFYICFNTWRARIPYLLKRPCVVMLPPYYLSL